MKRRTSKLSHALRYDLILIGVSIAVAILLVKSNLLGGLLTVTHEREFIGSFIAGLFFTSVFTTAPAMVTLGQIAQANSIGFTALFGACGAVIGDLIIFRFFRDRFSEHLMALVSHQGTGRRFRALLHLKFFRWFLLLIGGLIIASPLPDELGISFLGFSKAKSSSLIVVSFICNFIGIIIIGLVAKAF